MSNSTVFSSLRLEEYTGENRCVPCTIVNLGIALVLSLAIAVVLVELAVIVFVVSLVAIYLRGYLIPGTPELTKRYLPNRVLKLFDKHPVEEESSEQEWDTLKQIQDYRKHAVDPDEFLQDIGAVEPCDRETEFCYTEAFETKVQNHVRELSERTDGDVSDSFAITRQMLAEIYGIEESEISVEEREYPAIKTGRRVRKWPTEEALALDVALNQALHAQDEAWETVPQRQQVEIIQALRALTEQCPGCGGQIAQSEGSVESCCVEYEVISIGCQVCGAHLRELEPQKMENARGGFNP